MKKIYTFYEKGKPVAIVRKEEVEKFSRIFPQYTNKPTRAMPKLKGWLEVEQPRGRLIGYFTEFYQPSSILQGEFFEKQILSDKKE